MNDVHRSECILHIQRVHMSAHSIKQKVEERDDVYIVFKNFSDNMIILLFSRYTKIIFSKFASLTLPTLCILLDKIKFFEIHEILQILAKRIRELYFY